MGVERLSLNNFTNPLVRKKTADLKLIESQIFIQQRWVYSRSAETEIQDLQPCTAPKAKGKWILSSKGKGHWEGYSKKEKSLWLFIGGILARKEEEFFLLGSALSLLSPKFFKLKRLCINLKIFFPFWSKSFSESNTDQGSGFPVSVAFCTSVSERSLLDITSYLEEKVCRLQIMRVIFK